MVTPITLKLFPLASNTCTLLLLQVFKELLEVLFPECLYKMRYKQTNKGRMNSAAKYFSVEREATVCDHPSNALELVLCDF